jgi:hypothetical protein
MALAVLAGGGVAAAQTAREVFERIAPSVVMIRAHGRDVTAAGPTRSRRRAPASASRRTARS